MVEIQVSSLSSIPSIHIPGSKYIANRLIFLGSLSNGVSFLRNVPQNEDIQQAIKVMECLKAQFIPINSDSYEITPIKNLCSLQIQLKKDLYVGNSGTLARFITAISALNSYPISIKASKQMENRPMEDLILSLKNLGVQVKDHHGHLPITITGPVKSYKTSIKGNISSQYISALCLLGGCLTQDLSIEIIGKKRVSKPYLKMTLSLMKQLGVLNSIRENILTIHSQKGYKNFDITIESDPVSSSYFFLLGAIHQTSIEIKNYPLTSLQKEHSFPYFLEKMGCILKKNGKNLFLQAPSKLKNIIIDLEECPDIFPSLSIACMYAKGTSILKNLSHQKYKESNRLKEICDHLTKMKINHEIQNDDLHIVGGDPHGNIVVDPAGDHRIAMSFAIAATKTPQIKIKDFSCVNKSFPNFWKTLEYCGINLSYEY